MISVELTDAEGSTRTERALVDSGAESNCVLQTLVVECGLTPKVKDIDLATVEGKEVSTYGIHSLNLTATDTYKTTKSHRHDFVACDFDIPGGITIILGFPWLEAVDPAINFRTKSWRYPFEKAQINLLTAKKFRKEIKRSSTLYYVIMRAITPLKEQKLPEELSDFADICDTASAGVLPKHHPMEHHIDLEKGAIPPWEPVYPLSESELEVLREYLDTSEQKGWIRRSTSPAGAPILFVPKKDGGLRLCVDYRGLNRITIKNRTLLPLISETLDRLRRAVKFTRLDLKDAYHRLRIREGDEWKTAFRTRYGHYEYLVLPFGLTNAPATFQAYINQALIGLVDVTCVVYLDDILIYSEDPRKHTEAVRQVLERLRTYELFINLKKCEFSTDTVEFLGFVINPQGIRMDPSRVATIRDWPLPSSFKDIQVFLGFTNFYRRFIAGYSKVCRPLTDLLKGMERGRKDGPFFLTSEAREAFYRLRGQFLRAPLLRHFDPSLRIMVETDGSEGALGGILSQLFGGGSEARWHPIAFYSKKLSPVESRYEVHDIELMAIVYAFRQWGQYLRGASYTIRVRTDHNNLKYFMTKRRLNGRQVRWAQALAEFDFQIEYRPGRTNPADGLSRIPTVGSSQGSRWDEEELGGNIPTLYNKLRLATICRLYPNLGTVELFSNTLVSQEELRLGGEHELHPYLGAVTEGRRLRNDEMSVAYVPTTNVVSESCDVANRDLLKPVTDIAGCKQYVSRKLAISMLATETATTEQVPQSLQSQLLHL